MMPQKIVISIYKKSDDVRRIILEKNLFIGAFVLYSFALILCGNILNPMIINSYIEQKKEYSAKIEDDSIAIVSAQKSEDQTLAQSPVSEKIEQVEQVVVHDYTFMANEGDIFAIKESAVEQTGSSIIISFLLTRKDSSSKSLAGLVQIEALNENGEVVYSSVAEEFKFKSGRYTSTKIEDLTLVSSIKFYIAKIIQDNKEYTFLIK